jgi:hypothetical protein
MGLVGFKSSSAEGADALRSFPLGPARMAARAVSFGAGMRTTNFESLEEAYRHFDVTTGAAEQ